MKSYGFIKGLSTVLQLLKIFDDWTYKLDQGVQIGVIYTDFEKAFDKLPHLRLISKLKAYDIDSKLIVWIDFFVQPKTTNRSKRVFFLSGIYSKQWNSTSIAYVPPTTTDSSKSNTYIYSWATIILGL